MLRISAAVAGAILCVLGFARAISLEPRTESGLLPLDPPTPYYRYLPNGAARGRALVVHGLDANKNIMGTLAASLSDAGFDVFAIDLPGHGASKAGFRALTARQVVIQALDQIGGIDVAVGHSMGAGLLLDIANERTFSKLVLLSPPPTPVDRVDFEHTLVVTGVWDIPAINAFVPKLEGEGAEWWRIPWAAHSSAIYSPAVIRDIVSWLGGDTGGLRTRSRMFWNGLPLAGFLVLGLCLMGTTGLRPGPSRLTLTQTSVWFVAACAAALIVLRFVVVLKFLHLFATGYLISGLLLTGLALNAGKVLFSSGQAGFESSPTRLSLAIGIAASAWVIGSCLLSGSSFMSFALDTQRAWRFPVIALAGFPLFVFDETMVRPQPAGWKAAMTGILTRALLGASMLTGVLTLNRDDAFIVLIIHLVVLFWIVLWFLTGVVHGRTRSPIAAAIFASLVQGWFFAAWFVKV